MLSSKPGTGLTRSLVALFSAAAAVAVANLYYAQPLLPLMAATWGLSAQRAASTAMLTQAGYALGLLLIVPLGDRYERRRLITLMLLLASAALLAVGVSPTPEWLFAASFLMGAATITPQLLLPFAADLAPVSERGRIVGTVVSGIIVGILLARTLSATIAAMAGWRVVYFAAAALGILLAAVLRLRLPRSVPHATGTGYAALMSSLFTLLREQPVLRRSAFYSAMSFGAFSAFWSSMPFLLKGPPYHYGTATIGLFGLIGASGTLVAPMAGRWSDRGYSRRVTAGGLLLVLAAYLLLWADPNHLASFITGMLLLDAGTVASQTANQTRVYALLPEARNRINTVYMTVFFIGGALGSYAGAWGWSAMGWTGCSIAACSFIGAALVVFAARERRQPPRP